MKTSDLALDLDRLNSQLGARDRRAHRWAVGAGLILLLTALLAGTSAFAHSPVMDADLSDWCIGAFSNTAAAVPSGRVEDSAVTLMCGNCSVTTDFACELNSDCPAGESCVNQTSKTEIAWWDDRTDGAVNDLGSVVTTTDNEAIYFAAELWVDPDPVSLPFGEIAIDFRPGGNSSWHDPLGRLTNPGHCSASTDRACTSNADCHFCAISTEPFPSDRLRTCGSGCNPDIPADVCQTTETCVDLGTLGGLGDVGINSDPATIPDYMVLFDFSRWLFGAATTATGLYKDVGGTWQLQGAVQPFVNPGASGGSGGPPGSVEVKIPWSLFGCTGCPAACVCPDFGPGQDYKIAMIVARDNGGLDFNPDGAIEDTISESIGGTTTTTTNDCPGFGIGNTTCEISDGSVDSFIPLGVPIPGGRTDGLLMTKGGGSVTLDWNPSCSTSDTDYEVYQGDIGTWYSHVQTTPPLCSTAGAVTATFAPAGGSHYYLIVPTDGSTEGSYGVDSSNVERPASTSPCRGQSLGNCP